MQKFFTDLLEEDAVFYTFFGTKPLSSVLIPTPSKEKWLEAARLFVTDFDEERQQEILKDVEDAYEKYDLSKNWDRWIIWKKENANQKFLFLRKPTHDSNFDSGYILNVRAAEELLNEYYEVFAKELKRDFDVKSVLVEFENPDSTFWDKVLSHDFLIGILYGYGVENSRHFHEKTKKTHRISSEEDAIKDFNLPAFATYYKKGHDPQVLKFQKERKKIRENLRDKNAISEIIRIFKSTQ